MKKSNPTESGNKSEMTLHIEGRLSPANEKYVYHGFHVPLYATAVRVFLRGGKGCIFLAVFDPAKLRGSKIRHHGRDEGLLDLCIQAERAGGEESFGFLPHGEWKILIDSDENMGPFSYQLSVWVETQEELYSYYGLSVEDLARKPQSDFPR